MFRSKRTLQFEVYIYVGVKKITNILQPNLFCLDMKKGLVTSPKFRLAFNTGTANAMHDVFTEEDEE